MASAATSALLHLPATSRQAKWKKNDWKQPLPMSPPSSPANRRRAVGIRAFYNPLEDPLLKEALKEPVAFMGGMFAGLLRLDLNEEPLKEWITRTVEASGITEEEISTELKTDEDAPQQIEIE